MCVWGVLRVVNFMQAIIYIVLDELRANYLPAIHVNVTEGAPLDSERIYCLGVSLHIP
jgi:hypothetical protein